MNADNYVEIEMYTEGSTPNGGARDRRGYTRVCVAYFHGECY